MPWLFARLAFALPAIAVFAVRDGLFGAVLMLASGWWWQVSGSFVVVPCTEALVFGQLHRPDCAGWSRLRGL